MTADSSQETFTLNQIKLVADARDALVLEWAFAFKGTKMTDSVDSAQASILGALLAMKLRSPAKKSELRVLLRELVAYDGAADDWVVVRRVGFRPKIEKPPVRIDATTERKARPIIYDPETFLADLRRLQN